MKRSPLSPSVAQSRRLHAPRRCGCPEDPPCHYRALFDALDLAVIYQDRRGTVRAANPAAERTFRMSSEGFVGRSFPGSHWHMFTEDLVSYPTDQLPFFRALAGECIRGAVLYIADAAEGQMGWYAVDAIPVFRPREHRPYMVATTFLDISHEKSARAAVRERDRQLEAARDEARMSVDQDPLTGLLNHGGFLRRIDDEAARAADAGTSIGLVILDLCHFRAVNEAHGHAAGDEILRKVAVRLKAVCRPDDVVARFGGDEFAMALMNVGPLTREAIEDRVLAGCADLFYQAPANGQSIPIRLMAGASVFQASSRAWSCALQEADERLSRR